LNVIGQIVFAGAPTIIAGALPPWAPPWRRGWTATRSLWPNIKSFLKTFFRVSRLDYLLRSTTNTFPDLR